MASDDDFAEFKRIQTAKNVPDEVLEGDAATLYRARELVKHKSRALVEEYKRLDWWLFTVGRGYNVQHISALAQYPQLCTVRDRGDRGDKAHTAFQDHDFLFDILELTLKRHLAKPSIGAKCRCPNDLNVIMSRSFLRSIAICSEATELPNQCATWGWDREFEVDPGEREDELDAYCSC